MSNYPLGAENDPSAPYNQVNPDYEEIDVLVSVVVSKSIKIRIPFNSKDEEELYDGFCNEIAFNELYQLLSKGWNEDNITIIRE